MCLMGKTAIVYGNGHRVNTNKQMIIIDTFMRDIR